MNRREMKLKIFSILAILSITAAANLHAAPAHVDAAELSASLMRVYEAIPSEERQAMMWSFSSPGQEERLSTEDPALTFAEFAERVFSEGADDQAAHDLESKRRYLDALSMKPDANASLFEAQTIMAKLHETIGERRKSRIIDHVRQMAAARELGADKSVFSVNFPEMREHYDTLVSAKTALPRQRGDWHERASATNISEPALAKDAEFVTDRIKRMVGKKDFGTIIAIDNLPGAAYLLDYVKLLALKIANSLPGFTVSVSVFHESDDQSDPYRLFFQTYGPSQKGRKIEVGLFVGAHPDPTALSDRAKGRSESGLHVVQVVVLPPQERRSFLDEPEEKRPAHRWSLSRP